MSYRLTCKECGIPVYVGYGYELCICPSCVTDEQLKKENITKEKYMYDKCIGAVIYERNKRKELKKRIRKLKKKIKELNSSIIVSINKN